MYSLPLDAFAPAEDATPFERLEHRIDRIAEDQEEVVSILRQVQTAVRDTHTLLKAIGVRIPDEASGERVGTPRRRNPSTKQLKIVDCIANAEQNEVWQSEDVPRKGILRNNSRVSGRVPEAPAPAPHRSSLIESQGGEGGSGSRQKCTSLPPGWPVTIKLRPGMRIPDRSTCVDLVISENLGRRSRQMMNGVNWQEQRGPWWRSKSMFGPWNPHTRENVMYDCLGLVILLFDLCSTPFQLAWNVPIEGALYICSCISVIYWTVCIPVAFRTGFYQSGELRMEATDIAWNYLRKYLCFDIFLVAIDWIVIMIGDVGGTLRGLRVFRLFKVIRVLKIIAIFDKIVSTRLGNNSKGLVLVKVGGFTLLSTHMMCCAWYALGNVGFTDTDTHWTSGEIGQEGVVYVYFSAYHWVLSQITLGSNDISATNSYERFFCITLNVFGLLYSSVIISLISAQAMEYVTVRRERLEDMSRLSAFLDQHKVVLPMANRVRRQANDRLKANYVMLTEDSVKALSLLSADLRSEILVEVRSPHVVTHPLFQYWERIDFGAARRLCEEAVSFLALMPQDIAFMPSVLAKEAFYITPLRQGLSIFGQAAGPLSYSQSPETSFVEQEETVSVKDSTWVAEAALWTEWSHVGKLTAQCTCQLLSMNVSRLQHTLSAVGQVAHITRMYAREFSLRLHAASPPFSPWPTDLHVPDADPNNLLSEHAYRGLLMREWNAGRLNISQKLYEELLEEVISEKSAMVSVPGQGLQRVVFVCSLRLQRCDGHILVQVGKWTEAKGIEPACAVLPGTKRDRSELPHQALQRLLHSDLEGFEDGIELSHTVEEAEYRQSDKYGMMTKYLRTVNFADLRKDFPLPQLPTVVLGEQTAPAAPHRIHDLPDYCRTEVYVIHSRDDKADLYAWLSETDIDLVRGPEQDMLKSWIMSLDTSRLRSDRFSI